MGLKTRQINVIQDEIKTSSTHIFRYRCMSFKQVEKLGKSLIGKSLSKKSFLLI